MRLQASKNPSKLIVTSVRMEVILDCFFEEFGKMDRDTLHARYKRREMVDYFNTMIEGCCRGEF